MRPPAVAGQFYPSSADKLREQIEACFLHPLGPGKLPERGNQERTIVGAVVPHAGYMYSGYEAAHVYFALAKEKKPEAVILLGPNHTGYGSAIAVSQESWRTPLGEVSVDRKISEQLFKTCELIDVDELAHKYEHSIEVQLPFLQYIYGDFRFVPIALGIQDLETAQQIAKCIAKLSCNVAILASSDFTHYESREEAERKDKKAIAHILTLDEARFMQAVYELDASICGYGAIATCIVASRELGAKRGELLKYASSGEITGDSSSVVAYAGIVLRK